MKKNTSKVGESLEEQKPKKYRHWLILLYNDTKSYNFDEVLRIIKSQKKWAYIKHFPESNEKKEHYHIILSFENATKKETLSNKLGVPMNYIDEIKNLRSMCRYLVHKDDEEKYQYSLEQVKVSRLFEKEFKKQFDDILTDDEIIDKIYCFIDSLSSMTFSEGLRLLIQYVNSNCFERVYKRFRFEFTDYLKMSCN